MAINDSGEWWTGSDPSDIEEFLREYTTFEAAYPATAFHPIICTCGSRQFLLRRASTITERTCSSCGQIRYICRDRIRRLSGRSELGRGEMVLRGAPLLLVRCAGLLQRRESGARTNGAGGLLPSRWRVYPPLIHRVSHPATP
jgi:hypothetical protein